jgi:recombinational DNA repair protein (RecF pathway)
MRHKYETRGIVLSRSSVGEASTFITILTEDLGLVRALTQGVRRSGAKLAPALTTFAESSVILVRGKEGWRLTGAVLEENWFIQMPSVLARTRAARVGGLLLRLVADEADDHKLFLILKGFFNALTVLPEENHEAAEVLAAIRSLAALGLDQGGIPGEMATFTEPLLDDVLKERTKYIARINHGITVSGL